jgi:hypothetical protein
VKGKLTIPAEVRRFAAEGDAIDAVIQRIGLDTWDLLLIDGQGKWTRMVAESSDQARAAAEELGLEPHDGWDDDSIARRMNRRDHWNDPGGQKRAL